MKYPRFVREYASYQRKSIEHNSLMNPGIKKELIRRIDRYERLLENGFITLDECMRRLSLRDTGEDMAECISD